jgi:hypothetical protein
VPAAAATASTNAANGDCGIAGPLSTTAPVVTTSSAVSRAQLPSFYLGFTSRLLGTPVNVMLAVDREKPFDAHAPLQVDALIGSQFEPVAAADGTRGLGESGILSMDFPVEPTQTGLFGSTLAWLRITPRNPDAEWTPSLSGVYLNAVWAHAAETMTRELVGASTGEPGLTVALARPPVLAGTLELRVREPLGDEERTALLDVDPAAVKSAVENLDGDWVLWRQVPDTADCGPAERVYSLDEATGTIVFGDGHAGMIPPIGADAVVAFTYLRADAGVGDAVPANQLTARSELNLVSGLEGVEEVRAADNAAGGVPTDTSDRVLRFAPDRLRHRERAVSARDFESLALDWSPDAVQACCITRAGRVQLVVVMRGDDPAPSRAESRELGRKLLAAAPPTLAAPGALTIKGPGVRRLRIDLTLIVRDFDTSASVVKTATDNLTRYFDSATGGVSGAGYPLGASPGNDDIAAALLDIPNLESIASITRVEIDAAGNGLPWPASVRADELVMLVPGGVRAGIALAGEVTA